MTPEELAQVVAAVQAALAPAATAPVASEPARPRVASPFTAATAARPSSIAAEALRKYPGDRASQRAHIAISLAPRFTCSVDTTATDEHGATVPSALHGFTVAKTTGDPCPGVAGIPKGDACPGVIR